MKKEYKVLLISEESSSIKELHFSKFKLFIFFLFTGLVMFAITLVGVDFLTEQLYNFRLKRLEDERLAFRSELDRIRTKTMKLQDEMEKIIKHDDLMRTNMDLQQYDDDIRNVGVGGAELPKLAFSSFFSVEERLTNNLLTNLDKLDRQIDLERESFFEISKAFERNKELARYYPSIRPVDGGRLTDRFGWRTHPITGLRDYHMGIDLSVPRGTPIKAPADGVVIKAGWAASLGKNVQIEHKENEFGFRTSFGHLSNYNVKIGQKVKRGDIIGYVGSTGMTTAPHLHYEVIHHNDHVDPLAYYYDPSILY